MPLVTGNISKKKDPLNIKVPVNAKYKHIRSGLDTGASMTKHLRKIEDLQQNYRYRKDEIFKRMKVSTFVQLVIKVYEYNKSKNYEDNSKFIKLPLDDGSLPETTKPDKPPSPSNSIALTEGDYGESMLNTARSTLEEVSKGIGEMDVIEDVRTESEFPVEDEECPYLLLDIRDNDSFLQCHIISALNFPIAMLSRSVNGEIKELLKYKNKPGRIIVVYDEDERLGIRAATTLVERGYDNLFLLSGGLKVASKYFTSNLITGTLPMSIEPKRSKVITSAGQTDFTEDDVNALYILLDNALDDHSIGGRLSKASTCSSRMSVASVNSSTRSSCSDFIKDKPPFRL